MKFCIRLGAAILVAPWQGGTAVAQMVRRQLSLPTTNHDTTWTLLNGQYIVAFRDNAVASDAAARHFTTEQIQHVYNDEWSAFQGVAVTNVTERLLGGLLDDPDVLFVEQSFQAAVPNDDRTLLSIEATNAPLASPDPSDTATFSHLDRLDQRSFPLDGKYHHQPKGGERVLVFVVGSGMQISHPELAGRASCGFDAVLGEGKSSVPCVDLGNQGTAIGALVGGTTVGVAKGVRVVAVKVGTKQSVKLHALLRGINYVLEQKRKHSKRPMVVNLSLGFGAATPRSQSLDRAVQQLIQANVTVVVSASGQDSCEATPSRVRSAIVVGAMDPKTDAVPRWSPGGPCVDLYAPGVSIRTAAVTGVSGVTYRTLSGTVLAAPLVAGAAALYLHDHPSWTPAHVWQAMRHDATPNVLERHSYVGDRQPNLLLHTGRWASTEHELPDETECGKRHLLKPWLCWWKK